MYCHWLFNTKMSFTLILSSWIILNSVEIHAVKHENDHAPMLNISVFILKNGSESAVSGDEVRWSLTSLSANLQNVDTFGFCNNYTTDNCLITSKCPTDTTWNISPGPTHDSKSECFMLIPSGDTSIDQDDNNAEKPSSSEVWGYGILSVAIISLSGLFGGCFWPLMRSKYYGHVMRILMGLATGTLTATATMQLIPQAFGMKETDVDSYIQPSLIILGSVWSLYMFELCCKIYFYPKKKTDADEEMAAQNVSTVQEENIKQKTHEQEGLLPTIVTDSTNRKPSLKPYFSSNTSLSKIPEKERPRAHSHTIQMGGMAPVAWMIILGDSLHNFVDGMAIGAGFAHSISTGISISIAIACEEFPHELGDFAILINSGMPVCKALKYNFISALTAFLGLFCGIILGELKAYTLIFAFSGGLFYYISLANLMPELNNMVEEGLKESKKSASLVLFEQNCGILLGFCLLYFISSNPCVMCTN